MILRTLASSSLAGLLFAVDLVVLVLFLNPGSSLGRDALALLGCLLLPYWALASLGLSIAGLLGLLGRPPRRPRPVVQGLPFFASLHVLALLAAGALFWFNLWSYRFSIPHEFLRALALSSVSLSLAPLVLLAVGLDAFLFPRRSRGPGAATAVLAVATAVVVPLATAQQPGEQAGDAAHQPGDRRQQPDDGTNRIQHDKRQFFRIFGCIGLGTDLAENQEQRGQNDDGQQFAMFTKKLDTQGSGKDRCCNVDQIVADQDRAQQTIRPIEQRLQFAALGVPLRDRYLTRRRSIDISAVSEPEKNAERTNSTPNPANCSHCSAESCMSLRSS